MVFRATVEGDGLVPRVVLTGGTTGVPLEAEAGGRRWLVAAETPAYAIVDAQAPLSEEITYRAGAETVGPVVRGAEVYNAFTSVDGSVVVPFIMPHEWDESLNTGLFTTNAAGNRWSYYGRAPLPGSHPVKARVEGEHIAALRGLLREQAPFVFLHNKCPLPDCPVPPVLVVEVESSSAGVAGRKDIGEMVFSLDLQPTQIYTPAPARSWWHTLQENETWFEVDLTAEAFK